MPEIYIYNGSDKVLDLTSSIYDVMAQRMALVPPGSQGHFSSQDQGDIDATIAHLSRYGSTPHTVAVRAAATVGVGHSTKGPIKTTKGTPVVVTVQPPAKAPVVKK